MANLIPEGVPAPEDIPLSGNPVAGMSELVSAGSSVQQLWHQMGAIADPQSFYGLQNVIDESTRGNPNYGKKGFVNFGAYTGGLANGFKEMTTAPAAPQQLMKLLQNPETASVLRQAYVSNPTIRNYIHGEMFGSALESGGKLAEMGAIAMTPFDAAHRRDTYLVDYYNRTGKDPTKDGNLLPLMMMAGIDNTLNFATFGQYDNWTDNPMVAVHEYEDRMSASANAAQPVPEWVKARDRMQKGIDNPVWNGITLTRTTK